MPLNLLGKKSWNVYNQANIDRVRQDEAAAEAKEEAEEQRIQQEDAARRMALLRGEKPTTPTHPAQQLLDGDRELEAKLTRVRDRDRHGERERKRRKLRGEDDTDRDIRYAREEVKASRDVRSMQGQSQKGGRMIDAPVEDENGHIQLFDAPAQKPNASELTQDKSKNISSRPELPANMRFSDAAGFRSGMQKPWYTANSTIVAPPAISDRDVWGNEDGSRKEREQTRTSRNDPFAMMQQAQRQLKASEKDKEDWKKRRESEIEDVRKDEDREKRRRRRHRHDTNDIDSLDGFELDAEQDPDKTAHPHRRAKTSHSKHGHSRKSDERRNRHSHSRHRRRD